MDDIDRSGETAGEDEFPRRSHGITTIVSTFLFLALVAVVMLAPIDFIVRGPGPAVDLLGDADGASVIITDADTYETDGELLVTTAKQTSAGDSENLPTALIHFLAPHHDVLPREVVYPEGQPADEAVEQNRQRMTSSQEIAIVAALRQAGVEVAQMPMVSAVRSSGPSYQQLEVGDYIVSVDEHPVMDTTAVVERIRNKTVGDRVIIGVLRNGEAAQFTIPVAGSTNDGRIPTIGITVDMGYNYKPVVDIEIDPSIGGSSAGLAFALAIYDELTPGALTDGQTVAVTGTVTAEGTVGSIGAINEKIAAASDRSADLLLLPAANCSDIVDGSDGVRLVPVSTLEEAIEALFNSVNGLEGLPSC
ncbi:MAG: PDZ domain-containing protein [Propionibacteriaceae bacterium]|jgi:PDZ domain-containing protein|nr:PDZ domain-containing protein [Propionibacteriaceae bacterium]